MNKIRTKNKPISSQKNKAKLITPDIHPIDTYIQTAFLLLIFLLPLVVRLKLSVFISPFISIPVISTGMHASFFSYYKWVILVIITLITLGLFIFKQLTHKYLIRPSYINLPLAVLVVIILLSTLLADYKMIALTGYYDQHDGAVTYLCCLLLMLIATNIRFTESFGRRLTMVLGAATIIMGAVSLIHYMGIDLTQNSTVRILLAGREHADYAYGFLSSTLGNQNYTSGLAAALFCFFMALLIWGRKIIHPIYTVIFSLSALALLLTSLSSSGIVAAFIALVILVLLAGYDFGFKKIVLVSTVVIIILGLSFSFLVKQNPQLTNEVFFWKGNLSGEVDFSEKSSRLEVGSGRGYIWANTVELITDKPLLGHGANTMAYYFPHNNPNKNQRFMASRTIVDKPHNAYLGFTFNFGIPALLFLLYLFFAHLFLNLRQMVKIRNITPQRVYQIAIITFLLAYWVQGLFNDFVIGSAPLHWVLFGLGISLYHFQAEKHTNQPTNIVANKSLLKKIFF